MPRSVSARQVDLGAPIGDRRADTGVGGLQMKRIVTVAISAAFAGFCSPVRLRRRRRHPRGRGSRRRRTPAGHRCVRTAPATAAARADLSAGMGARRLSALQPRPQCRARLHRDLCAGVPAERHGDHPAHELLLAARLDSSRFIVQRISLRSRADSRGFEVRRRSAPVRMRAGSMNSGRYSFMSVARSFSTLFKSLASVCELRRGDAAYSIEPVGAGVIPATQGDHICR